MKKLFFLIILFVLGALATYFVLNFFSKDKKAPSFITQMKERPYDKYSIENLGETKISPSRIEVGNILTEGPGFNSYMFSMDFSPSLNPKEQKKVTGIINIPSGNNKFPVVVLYRGYIDQRTYKSGDGTKRVGEYFAQNGFITVAPDFLGYGQSDQEANNIFEARFQTYVTALSVLESVASLDKWDGKNVSIWGHSNGGQIALTVLEITKGEYPTVLWAPVSKPFPYSVLYYTDDSDDRGKLIRHELANFEASYDVDLYSIHKYYDRISAPIELHQGTIDDAVPRDWSDDLSKTLKKLEISLDYFIHPGLDHNMNPSWSMVIGQGLAFFEDHLD